MWKIFQICKATKKDFFVDVTWLQIFWVRVYAFLRHCAYFSVSQKVSPNICCFRRNHHMISLSECFEHGDSLHQLVLSYTSFTRQLLFMTVPHWWYNLLRKHQYLLAQADSAFFNLQSSTVTSRSKVYDHSNKVYKQSITRVKGQRQWVSLCECKKAWNLCQYWHSVCTYILPTGRLGADNTRPADFSGPFISQHTATVLMKG